MKPGNRATRARRALGAFGEQYAAAYLVDQGYQILARNWRCVFGEIDLVAADQAGLVFVEVRTRQSTSYGSAEESLTATKRARLARLAYAYLEAQPQAAERAWRIDLVAVELDRSGALQLRHLRNVVEE